MKEAEAQILAAKLAAAFPRDWAFVGEATNAVYVERIARLPRYEAASEAIDALIDGEARLPTIAQIRDDYRRFHDRYSPPALEEAQITDEERETNLARLRELVGRFGGES